MANRIDKLINEGENECLDFKQAINNSNKIAKTMVSFANHKGGTLLVGVRDNKTIAGIEPEEEMHMLLLTAQFYCKPEIEIVVNEHKKEGKFILEAIIPEGKNKKPYYAKDEEGKWWAYIRVNDKSLLASKIVVDVLKRNSSEKGTLIQYSHNETAIIKFLKENEKITQKEFCKLVNISRWRAAKILVNLVSVEVLRAHTTEKTAFFTLS